MSVSDRICKFGFIERGGSTSVSPVETRMRKEIERSRSCLSLGATTIDASLQVNRLQLRSVFFAAKNG